MRDLAAFPKAHLHLRLTGSMCLETLTELVSSAHTRLSPNLPDGDPLHMPADRRGRFRFQCAYNTARALVHTEEVMCRIVLEAAPDDTAEGSRRLGIQTDPTSYAPFVNEITPALEIIFDAAKQAMTLSEMEVAVIVAASRVRHPLDARILAHLMVRHAGDQPGEVIGFDLSSGEHAGQTSSWERASVITRRGGLASMPHGGELLGPDHLREIVSALGPTHLGRRVHTGEDPALLDATVISGIGLEVCPASNVSLGVYHSPDDVPLRTLISHGAQIALSANDPLPFRSRLVDQYGIVRTLGYDNTELAELARGSVRACLASPTTKQTWLAKVDAWLATPDQAPGV